jgi:hypothetical protein
MTIFLDVVDTSRGPCMYLLGVGGWVYFTLMQKLICFAFLKNGDLEFNSYGSYSEMGDPYECPNGCFSIIIYASSNLRLVGTCLSKVDALLF